MVHSSTVLFVAAILGCAAVTEAFIARPAILSFPLPRIRRSSSKEAIPRDFGPNTSGIDGSPAVINDVVPPVVIEPVVVQKADEIVIVKRPSDSNNDPISLEDIQDYVDSTEDFVDFAIDGGKK
ncbi:hypothetical protein BSKO_06103 [Bryopsis sp. KO-2023]|nr:hypothetical protein BSKO_06103 [Bryopsis sp. KO-2023]